MSTDQSSQVNFTPPSFTVHIESMAFRGQGVARHEGKVYFVDDGIEGDIAEVSVTTAGDRYSEARIINLIQPSPLRGPSPCIVSDACGGCQWQGINYSKQIEWKQQFITNALRRIGKIADSIDIEMLPSPQDNHYRNRIFVRARLNPDGQLKIGYFRSGSRDFIAIKECVIAQPRINHFVRFLLALDFSDITGSMELQQELKFRFEIQDLPSYSDSLPHILVSVYDADDTSIQMDGLIERFQTIPMVAWAGSSRRLHESPFFHFETDLGIQFHTAAGLFQQINISHNHTVRRLVLDTIKHYASKRVLDVFCGSGNLSLPLARDVQHIDGVEFSKRAIATAQHNTAVGGIKNANYYAGDTEKFLWRAAKQGVRYDMIIADPPREGMYKCLIPLMKLNPEVIIYVSCDPATLSRDLSSLCRQNYRIRRFVALDFFPNTYHIESFVVLEKGP